ncbi:MAG: LuxR C-terminal-related transcriptional regulator, partial [Solirubrobacteraceae bacterium]|nr:LuxR C-terminal-related transcriptional regulator [Solirubrobacteraceae bacterium]
VAAHLMLAPPSGQSWVSEMLVDAARASLRAGAPADAVASFTRALAEPPPQEARAAVTFALGRAAIHLDGPAAEGHLREALRLAVGSSARAHVALDLARLLMFLGRVGESIPLLRAAAAELGTEDADLGRMVITAELMASLYDPAITPVPEHLAAGARLPLEPGLGAKMLAAMTATILSHAGGSARDVADLARASLDGGDLLRADSVFLSVSAVLTLDLADRPEAEEAWRTLIKAARDHGSHPSRFSTNLFRGYALARRGALDDADRSLDDAMDALADWNLEPSGQWHAAAFRSFVRREQGDLVGARAALSMTPRPVDASDAARLWVDGEIRLLLAEGRAHEALAAADDATRRFAHLVSPLDTPMALLRARALIALERPEEAVAAAEEALAQARLWGAPGTVARALRVLGTAQGAGGIETLREAVDTATDTPARLELAKARLALGAALRERGDETQARTVLREALELAAQLGTHGLIADVRRELLAAGGRPRSTALSGPAALTASERRVAEQAAGGATNREIAEALVVTQKTVELHLSNAYRKLGVAGRRDLGAALETSEG